MKKKTILKWIFGVVAALLVILVAGVILFTLRLVMSTKPTLIRRGNNVGEKYRI